MFDLHLGRYRIPSVPQKGRPHAVRVMSRANSDVHLLGLSPFVLLPSGTVPLGVWKLPRTEVVNFSSNLLTHFTGEKTANVVGCRRVMP